jgi:hypothetical protein
MSPGTISSALASDGVEVIKPAEDDGLGGVAITTVKTVKGQSKMQYASDL